MTANARHQEEDTRFVRGPLHRQLRAWRKIFERNDFQNIQAVREVLPTADFADPYTIFNIKGNSYRLITVIHYRYKRVYIRGFMTHAQYNHWNKDRKRAKRK